MNNTAAPIAPALAYDAEPSTEMVEIRRDGAYVTTVNRGSALMAWFHQNCPMSIHWALTNEGYSIHEVPERFVVFAEYEEDGGRVEGIVAVKETRLAAKRAHNKFERTHQYENVLASGWRTEIAHNGMWVQR